MPKDYAKPAPNVPEQILNVQAVLLADGEWYIIDQAWAFNIWRDEERFWSPQFEFVDNESQAKFIGPVEAILAIRLRTD